MCDKGDEGEERRAEAEVLHLCKTNEKPCKHGTSPMTKFVLGRDTRAVPNTVTASRKNPNPLTQMPSKEVETRRLP